MSIPDIDETTGYLPSGIHEASFAEIVEAFGWNARRKALLAGLRAALLSLQKAGCRSVLVNGSFVTSKEFPGDIDACWDEQGVDPDKLDLVLLDFANQRAAQKAKFGCEFFVASWDATGEGEPFASFFQHDRRRSQGHRACRLGSGNRTMITNQRQYVLAKAQASRFEAAVAKERAKGPRKGVHPKIHQAKIDGLQSQLDELSTEISEFEALSSPDTPCEFIVTSVLDLSTVLIQARIASGWTQKQLAEALGMTEQQIQRYEATRYEGISLKRAHDIAKMLNVSFQGVGQYDKSQRAS